MLDAAEVLFVRDGYAATTITAIAEEADVAVQTVYAVFGSKRAILTDLVAARVVRDDEPAPLRERLEWQALEAESDPRRQLALLAATATRIWTLANPHTYRTLVIERGWSPADYEDWLAGVLACSLFERRPPEG